MSNIADLVDKRAVFAYLTTLQQSGQINMYGAPREIQSYFDLDKNTARQLFLEWVREVEG